jgi:hypothetical protein
VGRRASYRQDDRPIHVEKFLLITDAGEHVVRRQPAHDTDFTHPLRMLVSTYFYCPILHGFPDHPFRLLHASQVVK